MNEIGKIVHKPWGKEIWLELNDRYCYKRIYINAGMRTSYQYHEKKLETNYIIDGQAEIWLENDEGEIEKMVLGPGDFFTVHPPRKHRVVAITDIVLQEVSTPEVDDVVRIQDDIGRQNGKIDYEHRRNAVCILMAGTGSRMGYLADFINKGLLPINNKAIISHMIDKIPVDYEIVLALGYKQSLIKQYCHLAHPDRKFIFVDVGPFTGPTTGPSHSIDKCREFLQRPFYLLTADTIIEEPLPPLSHNWLGVSPTGIPELYSTVDVKDGVIEDFQNKSSAGFNHAFIGIGAIYDFKTFWEELDVESGEVVSAFYNIESYDGFGANNFNWYDLGTIENYFKARQTFEKGMKYGLIKTNGEFLYKIGERLIKLFANPADASGRIERQQYLIDHTPRMVDHTENMYAYEFVPGNTLYDLDDLNIFKNFLNFAQKNLWKPAESEEQPLAELCEIFYKEKTLKRLDMFLKTRDDTFLTDHCINGVETSCITKLLENLNWGSLYAGLPTSLFHGDLQFDNILYNDGEYCLIDWRQDFGGNMVIGDTYYDLAKLYGGALISYSAIKNDENFTLHMDAAKITYTYEVSDNLKRFTSFYETWIVEQGYDLHKVKTLAALIFLNMSPLHEKRLGNMLFFMSKRLLRELND